MRTEKIKKISEKVRGVQISPEFFLIVGISMVIGTLIKLLGFADFSSDWFWFITGLGLVSEGLILVSKKQKRNKTYLNFGN